jgi:hypothetical protein
MTLRTIADIAGANTTVQIATSGRARKLFFTSVTAASRFGDINTGAARGVSLPAGIPVTIGASDADIADGFQLSECYVYVPSGTTLTVAIGV